MSTETAKPSIAKAEEEKILLLRLESRGIAEVEQTDVQVRLQEIWRELSNGLELQAVTTPEIISREQRGDAAKEAKVSEVFVC